MLSNLFRARGVFPGARGGQAEDEGSAGGQRAQRLSVPEKVGQPVRAWRDTVTQHSHATQFETVHSACCHSEETGVTGFLFASQADRTAHKTDRRNSGLAAGAAGGDDHRWVGAHVACTPRLHFPAYVIGANHPYSVDSTSCFSLTCWHGDSW